jgi:hypothetical protein
MERYLSHLRDIRDIRAAEWLLSSGFFCYIIEIVWLIWVIPAVDNTKYEVLHIGYDQDSIY